MSLIVLTQSNSNDEGGERDKTVQAELFSGLGNRRSRLMGNWNWHLEAKAKAKA